jgi:phosphate acetyltransferase
MRVVTSGSMGLRTARHITHVFIMNVPTHSDTLFITDAAINIFPDLEAKRDIVQNAVDLYTQIGLGMRRVGILSAVETVTPKIPPTIDAATLCNMGDCGQITGGVLDGRLAFWKLNLRNSLSLTRRSRFPGLVLTRSINS